MSSSTTRRSHPEGPRFQQRAEGSRRSVSTLACVDSPLRQSPFLQQAVEEACARDPSLRLKYGSGRDDAVCRSDRTRRAFARWTNTYALHVLEDSSSAHAATYAHRDHAVASIAPFQLPNHRRCQLGAGAAQRMPQGDRSAIRIYLFRI